MKVKPYIGYSIYWLRVKITWNLFFFVIRSKNYDQKAKYRKTLKYGWNI